MTFHLGIEAVPSKQKLLEQVIRFYTVSSSLRRSKHARLDCDRKHTPCTRPGLRDVSWIQVPVIGTWPAEKIKALKLVLEENRREWFVASAETDAWTRRLVDPQPPLRHMLLPVRSDWHYAADLQA